MRDSVTQILVLIALVVTLAVSTGVLEVKRRRLRRRLAGLKTEQRGAEKVPFEGAVRCIALSDLDARFGSAGGWPGPGRAAEVSFVGRGDLSVAGAPSDTETWILSALAKGAERIFEFGTGSGRTSYAFAVNAGPDARVTTLALAPRQAGLYQHDPDDEPAAQEAALAESTGEFFYVGTPVEARIEQVFGDSKALDDSRHLDRYDLVFVDGAHSHSYVSSDSEKALRMVRPGGWVLWHDYRSPRVSATRGVFDTLNELSQRLPLRHVRGTSLVVWRRED